MQQVTFLMKQSFKVFSLVLILIFSLNTSTVFGQSNHQTTLKIKKQNATKCSTELSTFNNNLNLGTVFFLTLDLEELGDIHDIAIHVSIETSGSDDDTSQNITLFTGEIESLQQQEKITLPIYLNFDITEGGALIKIDMAFKDDLGTAFQVNDSLATVVQLKSSKVSVSAN